MEFPIQLSFLLMIVTIVAIVYYSHKGYRNGFVLEAIITVSLILCILAGWFLSDILNNAIKIIQTSPVETGISFADELLRTVANRSVLFIIIFIIANILLRLMRKHIRKLNKIALVGWLNKLLGSVLGFLKSIIYIILMMVVISSPIFTNGSKAISSAGLEPAKNLVKDYVPIAGELIEGFETIENIRSLEALENGLKTIQDSLK